MAKKIPLPLGITPEDLFPTPRELMEASVTGETTRRPSLDEYDGCQTEQNYGDRVHCERIKDRPKKPG